MTGPNASATDQQAANAAASLDALGSSEIDSSDLPLQSDHKAQREAISLNDGLDLKGKTREHNRHQAFRDHVNLATLVLLWLIVVALFAGIGVFAFHTLTPMCWHFLDEEQLSNLKSILGTAILSSALTGYAKNRMS